MRKYYDDVEDPEPDTPITDFVDKLLTGIFMVAGPVMAGYLGWLILAQVL